MKALTAKDFVAQMNAAVYNKTQEIYARGQEWFETQLSEAQLDVINDAKTVNSFMFHIPGYATHPFINGVFDAAKTLGFAIKKSNNNTIEITW